jgi:hypothetical protein
MEQAGERCSGRLFLSFHARVKPTAQFRIRSGMEHEGEPHREFRGRPCMERAGFSLAIALESDTLSGTNS